MSCRELPRVLGSSLEMNVEIVCSITSRKGRSGGGDEAWGMGNGDGEGAAPDEDREVAALATGRRCTRPRTASRGPLPPLMRSQGASRSSTGRVASAWRTGMLLPRG